MICVIDGNKSDKQFFSKLVGIGSKSHCFDELAIIICLTSSGLVGSKTDNGIPEKDEKTGADGTALSNETLIFSILSVKNFEKLLALSWSEESGRGQAFLLPKRVLTVEKSSLQVLTD